MKVVMAFGTFDIFHPGHVSFLNQAKKLGDYLIVVVAMDKNVIEIKKKKARNKEKARVAIVKQSKLADKVILGNLKNKYAAIKKYQPNVIALGYDQAVNMKSLKEYLNNFNIKSKIIRLKSFKPEKYKSSKLRREK